VGPCSGEKGEGRSREERKKIVKRGDLPPPPRKKKKKNLIFIEKGKEKPQNSLIPRGGGKGTQWKELKKNRSSPVMAGEDIPTKKGKIRYSGGGGGKRPLRKKRVVSIPPKKEKKRILEFEGGGGEGIYNQNSIIGGGKDSGF